MRWGEEIHSTIERRDTTALHRMAEEAGKEGLRRCVTCKRIPLTLYTFCSGVIARVRFGCLCSSVIVDSYPEQSARIPVGAPVQVMKPA